MKNDKCKICKIHNDLTINNELEIWRENFWLLRHHPYPAPLKGWLLLDSTRHIQGPHEFSVEEASSWGPTVQKATQLVMQITSCQRVYLIAFGEGAPHLHLHLIPRFSEKRETKAWQIADYYRAIENGKIKPVNLNEIKAIVHKARRI